MIIGHEKNGYGSPTNDSMMSSFRIFDWSFVQRTEIQVPHLDA